MSSHFSHCQNQNPLCLLYCCPSVLALCSDPSALSPCSPTQPTVFLWCIENTNHQTRLTLYTCSSCLNALVPRWHCRLCSQVSFPVEPPDAYSAALTLFSTFFLLLCAQTQVVVSLLPLCIF